MLVESVWLYSCCCKVENSRCDNMLVYHEKEILSGPFLNGGVEVRFFTIYTVFEVIYFHLEKHTVFFSHDTGLSFYLLDLDVHI